MCADDFASYIGRTQDGIIAWPMCIQLRMVGLHIAFTLGSPWHAAHMDVTTHRIGDIAAARGSSAANDLPEMRNDPMTSVITGSFKAGEGIRTPDVQLGKRAIPNRRFRWKFSNNGSLASLPVFAIPLAASHFFASNRSTGHRK
jgi:hypothetical protein